MRNPAPETLAASIWGLNFTSYVMQSVPYLQAASLILAIVVSIMTIRKLNKEAKRRKSKPSN